jgi:hypothetical protein
MQISAQHLAEIVDAARKSEKTAADKRRYIRQTVVTRVELLSHEDGTTYAALTRDLSLEGVGLLQSVPMERGEQFSVSLPRIKSQPLLVQCTVLHMREIADGIFGIGAAFVSVTELSAKAQADLTSKTEAQRISAKMLD